MFATFRHLLLLIAIGLMSPQIAIAKDFTLEGYFTGKTSATGHFSAINGIKRDFTVDLTGRWNGKILTLREDFLYSDGERDRKTWRFTKTGPSTYSGTREDVSGKVKVRIEGNTARFTYLVFLDSENRKNQVRFWDKMVLGKNGKMLNTALVTKFGFPVAKTTVKFQK
ncbi:DUF3833 family protein [Agrobacterium sp. ES01]|uniref:DUF3833 family protein n=1 Tax=Agrobacterium sp. ES01 TaxID=3420714 RepID=UPI003D1432E4